MKVEAYYNIDSLTESASVFPLRRKPRLKLFESCNIYFFLFRNQEVCRAASPDFCSWIHFFPPGRGAYVITGKQGLEIRILFSTRSGPQLATLILAVRLDTGLIVRFLRRSSPCPSVREASIFQFARGINWRRLSRAARRRRCVDSPSGAQKRLVDCCRRD